VQEPNPSRVPNAEDQSTARESTSARRQRRPTERFTRKSNDILRAGFQAIPAYIARLLAERAAEQWKENPEIMRGQGRPCLICVDPKRQEVDYLLLVGATFTQLRALMPGYRIADPFVRHRDAHLVPLIEAELKPSKLMLHQQPYPEKDDWEGRARFYIMQHYGLYHQALLDGNLVQANLALREMRSVDFDVLLPLKQPKQLPPPAPEPQRMIGAPQPDVIAEFTTEQDEKLKRAFARSRRKPEGEEDGATQEEPGDPQNT
jgi:hypothetical protein